MPPKTTKAPAKDKAQAPGKGKKNDKNSEQESRSIVRQPIATPAPPQLIPEPAISPLLPGVTPAPLLPQWTDAAADAACFQGDQLFTDADGYPLLPEQLENAKAEWKRLPAILEASIAAQAEKIASSAPTASDDPSGSGKSAANPPHSSTTAGSGAGAAQGSTQSTTKATKAPATKAPPSKQSSGVGAAGAAANVSLGSPSQFPQHPAICVGEDGQAATQPLPKKLLRGFLRMLSEQQVKDIAEAQRLKEEADKKKKKKKKKKVPKPEETDGFDVAREESTSPVRGAQHISLPSAAEIRDKPDGPEIDKYVAGVLRVISVFAKYLPSDAPFLWEALYPKAEGMPILSPTGKYHVKVFLMGSWRCLTIDDFVPVDSEGNVLFLQSSHKMELWSSLLAKAIYKLLALHGLNQSFLSSPEETQTVTSFLIHSLTGWFPEENPFLQEPMGFSLETMKMYLPTVLETIPIATIGAVAEEGGSASPAASATQVIAPDTKSVASSGTKSKEKSASGLGGAAAIAAADKRRKSISSHKTADTLEGTATPQVANPNSLLLIPLRPLSPQSPKPSDTATSHPALSENVVYAATKLKIKQTQSQEVLVVFSTDRENELEFPLSELHEEDFRIILLHTHATSAQSAQLCYKALYSSETRLSLAEATDTSSHGQQNGGNGGANISGGGSSAASHDEGKGSIAGGSGRKLATQRTVIATSPSSNDLFLLVNAPTTSAVLSLCLISAKDSSQPGGNALTSLRLVELATSITHGPQHMQKQSSSTTDEGGDFTSHKNSIEKIKLLTVGVVTARLRVHSGKYAYRMTIDSRAGYCLFVSCSTASTEISFGDIYAAYKMYSHVGAAEVFGEQQAVPKGLWQLWAKHRIRVNWQKSLQDFRRQSSVTTGPVETPVEKPTGAILIPLQSDLSQDSQPLSQPLSSPDSTTSPTVCPLHLSIHLIVQDKAYLPFLHTYLIYNPTGAFAELPLLQTRFFDPSHLLGITDGLSLESPNDDFSIAVVSHSLQKDLPPSRWQLVVAAAHASYSLSLCQQGATSQGQVLPPLYHVDQVNLDPLPSSSLQIYEGYYNPNKYLVLFRDVVTSASPGAGGNAGTGASSAGGGVKPFFGGIRDEIVGLRLSCSSHPQIPLRLRVVDKATRKVAFADSNDAIAHSTRKNTSSSSSSVIFAFPTHGQKAVAPSEESPRQRGASGSVSRPPSSSSGAEDNGEDGGNQTVELVIEGSIDYGQGPLPPWTQSRKPFLSTVARQFTLEKEAEITATGGESSREGLLRWRLEIFAANPQELSLDTSVEDAHEALKAAWESADPGRAVRSKASRLNYMGKGAEAKELLKGAKLKEEYLKYLSGAEKFELAQKSAVIAMEGNAEQMWTDAEISSFLAEEEKRLAESVAAVAQMKKDREEEKAQQTKFLSDFLEQFSVKSERLARDLEQSWQARDKFRLEHLPAPVAVNDAPAGGVKK